jgi:hypothetical protein
MALAPKADWEAIGREYRAGQLSLREIGRIHGVSDTAIRKKAKAEGWERDLTEQVQAAVRAKLVREDGSQGSHPQRTTDRDIVRDTAARAVEVVRSHRRSLAQLNAIGDVLAERLAQHLDGIRPDGPGLGDKESPSDMLEKLSRTRQRAIQLERQAFNLDSHPDDDGAQGSGGGALERLVARLDRAKQSVAPTGAD